MATIDLATNLGSGLHMANTGTTVPYLTSVDIDLAEAVTTKGSALAQADVIESLDIPATSVILSAGLEIITAMGGTSTDATIDLGITGGDVDNFVDGFDLDGASAGDYAPTPTATAAVVVATADTLDILIVTQTGTILTGVIRVWAVVVDVDAPDRPGRAALQS